MKIKTKRKLLIIDDEKELLESLKLFLSGYNFDVNTFSNIDQAIASITHNNYDLILTDIEMPIKSGIHFVEIVTEGLGVTVPILFMTGKVNVEYLTEAIRLGVADFIAKPIQPNQLLEIINHQINRSKTKLLGFELDHATINFQKSYKFYSEEYFTNSIVRYLFTEIIKNISLSAYKKNELYLVLEEVISNAFFHGLWKLTEHERNLNREALLEIIFDRQEMVNVSNLADSDFVYVEVGYKQANEMLYITVKDSGKGFNFKKYIQTIENAIDFKSLTGRGLFLINTLCEKMSFSDEGSRIDLEINTKSGNEKTKLSNNKSNEAVI
jgi:DNA-binding response OmpR family regulator